MSLATHKPELVIWSEYRREFIVFSKHLDIGEGLVEVFRSDRVTTEMFGFLEGEFPVTSIGEVIDGDWQGVNELANEIIEDVGKIDFLSFLSEGLNGIFLNSLFFIVLQVTLDTALSTDDRRREIPESKLQLPFSTLLWPV